MSFSTWKLEVGNYARAPVMELLLHHIFFFLYSQCILNSSDRCWLRSYNSTHFSVVDVQLRNSSAVFLATMKRNGLIGSKLKSFSRACSKVHRSAIVIFFFLLSQKIFIFQHLIAPGVERPIKRLNGGTMTLTISN